MKFFSYILVSLFCLLTINSQAQTKMVAHKSHSGAVENFSTESAHNFGLPSETLIKVVKINPTTIVEYSSYGGGRTPSMIDTTSTHPVFLNPEYTLVNLKKMYPHIEFIGFGTKAEVRRQEREMKKAARKAAKETKKESAKSKTTSHSNFPFKLAGGISILCLGLGLVFYKQASSES